MRENTILPTLSNYVSVFTIINAKLYL